MKYHKQIKRLLTGLLMLCSMAPLHAKSLTDLSGINTLTVLKAFREQLVKEGKDNFHTANYVYLDSAVWNGIVVQRVALYEDNIDMTITKESGNGTKKAIGYLQSRYKGELEEEIGWYNRVYAVNNSQVMVKLSMEVEKEQAVQGNTASVLNLKFKPVYTQAYPNISKKIEKDPNGIFYFLDVNSLNNSITVLLNGIEIYSNVARYQYVNEESINLNPYILGKGEAAIRIVITPGLDTAGKAFSQIQKNSYVSGTLQKGMFKDGKFETLQSTKFCNFQEYVTDTIVKNGDTSYSSYPGTYHYGGRQLDAGYTFVAEVPYTVRGWKEGADLSNDKKIKEKITALYEKLAQAITNKDAEGMSNLFQQMGEETIVTGYNQDPARVTDTWGRWMATFAFTNIIKIEKDFDIEISEDGKLVYASPKQQKDMLRAIGKGEAEGFTRYMYEDKNTNELKFIR